MVKYCRLYMYNYIRLNACRDNDPRLFWGLSSNLGTTIFLEFGTMEGIVWLLNLESRINGFWDLRIRQLMELSFVLFQREGNVNFCFTKGVDVVIQVFKWVVFFIIWSSRQAYDLSADHIYDKKKVALFFFGLERYTKFILLFGSFLM